MLSSDDVAVWTCSQLTVCVECKVTPVVGFLFE